MDLNRIGSGDSFLAFNLVDPERMDSMFDDLLNEINFHQVYHKGGAVPRLFSEQYRVNICEIDDIPVYRHPIENDCGPTPMTPLVKKICEEAEARTSTSFNHVLIQLYRDGKDHITPHADKTLDILRGSLIANWSLGRERVLVLRSKEALLDTADPSCTSSTGREIQKVKLPSNSLFVLGPETNRIYTHAIKPAHDDGLSVKEARRISFTFRSIATYRNQSTTELHGQGEHLRDDTEAGRAQMLHAFGQENKTTKDWTALYA